MGLSKGKKKVESKKLDPKTSKEIVASKNVSTNNETLVWRIGQFDWEGPWGISAFKGENLKEFLEKVKWRETMTWAEILQQSGGRRFGTNNHPVRVSKLIKRAQDRLEELEMDDIDELMSLRINGTARLFGIRAGRVLQVLWYDPKHEVCPSYKQNT